MTDYQVTVLAARLGIQFERARQQPQRDWETLIRLEHAIADLCNAYPERWLECTVVEGRNLIRRALRQEELHV